MGDGPLIITNKTYVAKAKGPIDLECRVLTSLPQYRPPTRFSGGVLKLENATYLLFKSGKVVINGLGPQTNKFINLTKIEIERPKLLHCGAAMSLMRSLDVKKLIKVTESTQYEFENHPGIVFKLGHVSVTAHESGAIFICGCKGAVDATRVARKVVKLINTHEVSL